MSALSGLRQIPWPSDILGVKTSPSLLTWAKQGKCFLDTDLCLAIWLCSVKLLESLLFPSFWEQPLDTLLYYQCSQAEPPRFHPSAHLVIWYFEHSVHGAKLFVAPNFLLHPKPFSEPLQVSLMERAYKKRTKCWWHRWNHRICNKWGYMIGTRLKNRTK